MNNAERKSFVVSSSHDPAAIALLAQFYSSRGVSMSGSFGELMNTLVDEVMLFHGLTTEKITQEQAITTLNALGFSTKQLEGTRGRRRAARRAQLEEIQNTHSSQFEVPAALQKKLDGTDMTPWTKSEISQLVELKIITPDQADEAIGETK